MSSDHCDECFGTFYLPLLEFSTLHFPSRSTGPWYTSRVHGWGVPLKNLSQISWPVDKAHQIRALPCPLWPDFTPQGKWINNPEGLSAPVAFTMLFLGSFLEDSRITIKTAQSQSYLCDHCLPPKPKAGHRPQVMDTLFWEFQQEALRVMDTRGHWLRAYLQHALVNSCCLKTNPYQSNLDAYI